MLLLPPTFALWQDMADCVAQMEFQPEVDGPTAATWTYRYNESGDMWWATMEDSTGFTNIVMTFGYDPQGRLIQIQTNPRPDGGATQSVSYAYDAGDLILAESDDRSDGTVDRITRIAWAGGQQTGSATDKDADGDDDSWTVTWTEDSTFRLLEFEEHVTRDSDSGERYRYDALGRLTETLVDQDGDGSTDRTVWRGYDASGRITWKDADNDGDGVTDTTASWTWWCPGGHR